MSSATTLEERLERMEGMIATLVDRQQVRQWYTVEEFARIACRAEFTVREWCRLGLVHAEKRNSGRGPHAAWVVSHEELMRFQREGLLRQPGI